MMQYIRTMIWRMCRSSINDAGAVGAVAAITPQDPDTAAAARAGVAQRPVRHVSQYGRPGCHGSSHHAARSVA
eukprot:scaffold3862_cov148-Isochrysis_galbana.AAC.1